MYECASIIGAPPEMITQQFEKQALAIAKSRAERRHAPALTNPGARCGRFDDVEQGGSDLREEMHMMMSVHEIGRTTEAILECLYLQGDLSCQRLGVEPAQHAITEHRGKRQEASRA